MSTNSTEEQGVSAGADGLGAEEMPHQGPIDAGDVGEDDGEGEDFEPSFPATFDMPAPAAPAATEPQAPAPDQPPPGVDPWAAIGIPEEVRKAKGWDDPRDIGRAYLEAERRVTELGTAVSQREDQLGKMLELLERSGLAQQQQQQAPHQEQPVVDFERMADDAFGGDPSPVLNILAHEYVPALVDEMIRQRLAPLMAQIDQRIQPIAQTMTQDKLVQLATSYKNQYGDAFTEVADDVMQTLRDNPRFAGDEAESMRAAFGLAFAKRYSAIAQNERESARQTAEREARARAGDQAAQNAHTLDGAAVGPTPVQGQLDPAQAVRDSIRNAVRPTNDGLGY